MKYKYILILVLSTFISRDYLSAQERIRYQSDFTIEEITDRRNKIIETIGQGAIALIQGANGNAGFNVFRQSNSFYYLSGLETAHAYILINGRSKRTTLYLPHRDEGREPGEGKVLSAEDAGLVKELPGVDQVRGIEFLSADLVRTGLIKPPAQILYSPVKSSRNRY